MRALYRASIATRTKKYWLSGTSPRHSARMQWDNLFAARTASMKRSTIRQLLKLTNEPDMISFAGALAAGLPAAELLPSQEVVECVARVMKQFGSSALQFGATEGVSELRDWVARTFSTGNLQLSRDNVLIVSGAQQGLDMLGRVFLDAG